MSEDRNILSNSLVQSQGLRQEMRMTPEQRMGLEVLQKPAMELQTAIDEKLQMNPLLVEVQTPSLVCENELPVSQDEADRTREERELDGDGQEFREQLLENAAEWNPDYSVSDDGTGELTDSLPGVDQALPSAGMLVSTWNADSEERRQHFFDSYSKPPGLQVQLQRECDSTIQGTEEFRDLCRNLCLAIDGGGYLRGSDEELCQATGASEEDLHRAIRAIQSLDPPGIGARDLRQCLMLQLERAHLKGSLEWEILDEHTEDLSRNRLPQIARAMNCELDEIQDAVARIRELNPAPGGELYSQAAPTVTPEVFLERDAEGNWTIRPNRDAVPVLALNADYLQMLGDEGTDAATRNFIRSQATDAGKFIYALDQREKTILRLTEALLELQRKYFTTGDPADLVPMKLERLADRLDLAESTISRAISGKYLMTPWGPRSYKSFLSTAIASASGGDVSSVKIRARIRELISQEDPLHPISDQDISDQLQKEGYKVARRTVVKYRDMEGIPTSSLRRIHK